MIRERIDYSSLLDILKYAYNNYQLDSYGRVFNSYNKEEHNEKLVSIVKFSYLYCLAYRTLYEMQNNKPIDNMDKVFINEVFTNYAVFNSFMNNSINEYMIYDDIGTGNISYVPYETIAAYIYGNFARKKVFADYLTSETMDIKLVQNFSTGRSK